jgi:hypothetical protein
VRSRRLRGKRPGSGPARDRCAPKAKSTCPWRCPPGVRERRCAISQRIHPGHRSGRRHRQNRAAPASPYEPAPVRTCSVGRVRRGRRRVGSGRWFVRLFPRSASKVKKKGSTHIFLRFLFDLTRYAPICSFAQIPGSAAGLSMLENCEAKQPKPKGSELSPKS